MKKKFLFSLLLLSILFACIPVHAVKLKTYKAKKVTAKQIVTQLKKVTNVGTVRKHEEADLITGQINAYKSKYSFYDKEYNKTYCSIEVFEDIYDAVYRAAYLDSVSYTDRLLGLEETIPWKLFRYKNVLFRYPYDMPYNYAAKYYKYIKKIVK